MDKSKAKEIVDASIRQMMFDLGVQHWKIEIRYEAPENPNWMASCRRFGDYHQADICIDPERHDDAEQVLRSLRHELIHIVLAPFDLYRDAIFQFVPEDPAVDRLDKRLFTNSVEQAVLNIERLLEHGLNYRPWEKKPKRKG